MKTNQEQADVCTVVSVHCCAIYFHITCMLQMQVPRMPVPSSVTSRFREDTTHTRVADSRSHRIH